MNFPSIRLEGGIFSADLLDAIAREDKHSQKPGDFGLDPAIKVKDEIASTWASAKALWTGYQAKIASLREGQTGVSETRNLFVLPLLALLGYQPDKAEAEILNGKSYAISHRDPSRDGFPIHIMGWHDSLEKKRTVGGPRVSSHALVQEYLNLTEHLYGIITNGRQLRLLRDSSRLIKLSFLEFDLNRIFGEDLYADFAILFRLLHASRMPANRTNASSSVIERYHQESVDSGARIRDGLAAAVAFAMQTVANGLLAHSANACLLEQLKKEPARAEELHQNLLRWVYRTLFVAVIEERVLHHTPAATLRQRQLYRDFYSLQRLRRLADRPQLADRRAHDLWRAMHQTLRLYEDGGKGLPLGIAPLGSFLFREEGLQALFQYELDNRSLLQALNRLSTFTHPDTKVRMRVNYGALDVEEFGSVYESLLELRPRLIPEGDKLSFTYAQLAGNERKTTGSYYTPDSLVQCLLDSALDPVIEERLKEARESFESSTNTTKRTPSPPSDREEGRGEVAYKNLREALEKALLSIKVCDPAVGSGHFLIGAAHRLAQRLAEIRAGEEALSPDVQRHALRDVVSRCLYGVDINPLSVELCKVSLWMLGMEPGKPLSFLDHHIRCGNSLLGTTPELVAAGIPDGAFNPIEGDDKKACAELKKRNKAEREGLGILFAREDAANREKLHKAVSAIDEIDDDSPEAIRRKETAFRNTQQNYDFQKAKDLADLWCAAFVIKKHFPSSANGADKKTDRLEEATREDLLGTAIQPLTATQAALFGGTEEPGQGKGRKLSASKVYPLNGAWGITTKHLQEFVEGRELPEGLLSETKRLSADYQLFHWHLAFPEVFVGGGFDVNLGNPPWERVKLQEKEWFAERRPEIAHAPNAATRKRIIESIRVNEPTLYIRFQEALRNSEGEAELMRNNGLYPLCGRGDINLYAVFAERMRILINPSGRVGCVLPTGIATDDTTKFFFQDIVEKRSLVSLYDFENRDSLFPQADRNLKFCLFTVTSRNCRPVASASFVFAAIRAEELQQDYRRFTLTTSDIALLNPNTKTCPSFRSSLDAELSKAIYRRIPVLLKDGPPEVNPWRISFMRMFDMANDSIHFKESAELQSAGFRLDGNIFEKEHLRWLPLYEAKMMHQFDHRFAHSEQPSAGQRIRGSSVDIDSKDHVNPNLAALPRYWINEEILDKRYKDLRWSIVFRDVTGAVANIRTVVSAILGRVAVGHKAPLILLNEFPARYSAAFVANLNSFIFDYCARQKLTGISLSYFILKQLPATSPEVFDQPCQWQLDSGTLHDWLVPRMLELTYTAWDLEAFAQDCDWSGPPFRWDEERRFLLRCELDAAFFHLYLGSETEWQKQPKTLIQAFPMPRDAVAYIMETFPIVKRKDEGNFNGQYRTKDTILEIYDTMAECIRAGKRYSTRLNPPPASLTVAHPWNWETKKLELPASPRVPLPETWQYVVNVMVELLWQAGGSLPWRTLRTATDLLGDRKRLAKLAEAHVGQVADDWLALDGDSFDGQHRWDQLSGFCHAGKMRVVRQNDELLVELLSVENHVFFPHVRFDARLALTVGRSQQASKPTPAEAQEEQQVAKLIPA